MFRVLIGSCGGLTGVYLAKQFHRFSDVELFGFDSNVINCGKLFCKKVFDLPQVSDKLFMEKLINLLKSENIDLYIPTHSKEIIEISKNEEFIRKQVNTKFIVCPYDTYCALNSKKNANLNLSKIGIPVPKLYNRKNIKTCEFPIVAKKCTGSGGSSFSLIYNLKDVDKFFDDDYVLLQYISGVEYTVDCLFSEQGQLLGYNQRIRNKCIGGAVSITTNDNSFDILSYLMKISKQWIFKGCINFQYILVNQTPYFIDCNLRYASGGLPLSVESGVDVPLALYKILKNEEIENNEFISDFKSRTMYRYFEEKFISE